MKTKTSPKKVPVAVKKATVAPKKVVAIKAAPVKTKVSQRKPVTFNPQKYEAARKQVFNLKD